ncbi:MAG TPA: dihydrofolate reductase family protein [Candidatus Limnocylindrales bacterium]|jgi:dihydrofolate reductase
MRRIVVNNSVTLDGVMQAPGRPDEDRRGGFEHGGWAAPYFDSVMAEAAGEGMANATALLFGRRTYEDFASVWPTMPEDNPFTTVINESQKLVASRTLKAPLSWKNSTLLEGDAAEAIARLRQEAGPDLVILGSGELIQSLMLHDLINEFRLLIHPLVLGSGRRLFVDGGALARFRLMDTKTSTTGVVIATYRPAEQVTA